MTSCVKCSPLQPTHASPLVFSIWPQKGGDDKKGESLTSDVTADPLSICRRHCVYAHTHEARGQVKGTRVWGISQKGMGQATLSREGWKYGKWPTVTQRRDSQCFMAYLPLVSTTSQLLPNTRTCMIRDPMATAELYDQATQDLSSQLLPQAV